MESKIYTLITGATGGLGKAFCNELCKLNHNIIISGTSEERLSKLQLELKEKYQNADILYFACNLGDTKNIDFLFSFLDEKNISINTLINNAGYITEGSFVNATTDDLMQAIKVNCEGTVYLTKKILDRKLKKDKLKIITISSMAGRYPMPYMAIYSSTKSFLTNIMLALKHEYKKDNVSFLVVEPGAIATSDKMKEAIKAQGLKGKLSSVKPEIIAKKAIKKSNKNVSRYTPGLFNKLTNFFSIFTTKNFQAKFSGNMWKKSQDKRNIK